MANREQEKIDAYLGDIHRRLRGMDEQNRREIVAELRSHILEKSKVSGVDQVLTRLGNPAELAKEYQTNSLLQRVEHARSPLSVLRGLFHWASLSVAGVLVLLACIVGYTIGIAFYLCALLKLLHPHAAGLWVQRTAAGDLSLSLHLGFDPRLGPGREVLGWWIVPIGLIGGGGLILLITRAAVWCVRAYRGMGANSPRHVEELSV